MMMPNTREEFITPLYPTTKAGREMQGQPNPYWEGHLNEDDKRAIEWYDEAVDRIVNDIINLAEDNGLECDVRPSDISLVLNALAPEIETLAEYHRNAIIVSFIDNYEEVEE